MRSNGVARRMSQERFQLEERVTKKEARRVLGLGPRTFERYSWKGLLNRVSGQRVKLETFQDGPNVCTTLEAYARFQAELNGETL